MLSKLAQLGFLCNLMLIKSIFGFIDKTSFTFKLLCGPLFVWWNHSVSNTESIGSYISQGFSWIPLTYNIYLKYTWSKYVKNLKTHLHDYGSLMLINSYMIITIDYFCFTFIYFNFTFLGFNRIFSKSLIWHFFFYTII